MKDEIFIIPEEVKSEFKFGKHFYMTDIYIVIGSYFLFDFFSNLIYPPLRIPYLILSVLFGFIISRKSRLNPDKRVITSFIYRIVKPKQQLKYIRIEGEGSYEDAENE